MIANLTAELVDPGVPVTHFYGTGVGTPTAFEYEADSDASVANSFRRGPTRVVYGDGDGTVPLRSLQSVERRWADVQTKAYANQTHTGLLKQRVHRGRDPFSAVGGMSSCGRWYAVYLNFSKINTQVCNVTQSYMVHKSTMVPDG